MREPELRLEGDAIPPAGPEAGGGPLANAVEGEDGRFLERRRKESASGVRLVVLGEDVALAVLPPESG